VIVATTIVNQSRTFLSEAGLINTFAMQAIRVVNESGFVADHGKTAFISCFLELDFFAAYD